jgi:hypothetical protein
MTRTVVGCGIACMFAMAIGVAAQDPPIQPQAKRPAAQEQPMITVEGCLMREQDVPGRKPNVAERAGVLEDYILASAKMISGSPPQAVKEQAKPGEPTGTSGRLAPMYDVKGLDDEKLKPLAGKRVQIDGSFADVTRSPSAGPTEDLVDIRATAIRPATGDCPAK